MIWCYMVIELAYAVPGSVEECIWKLHIVRNSLTIRGKNKPLESWVFCRSTEVKPKGIIGILNI
jgi:hypothetical protein